MNNYTHLSRLGTMFLASLVLLVTASARADYKSTVLGDKPIGYWPLNLAVDTGGIATDLSGNTNNGAYDGVYAQVPGPSPYIINAVSFDGGTTLVDLSTGSHTALLNFGGTITMEAWVQTSYKTLYSLSYVQQSVLGRGHDSADSYACTEMGANYWGNYDGGSYSDSTGKHGQLDFAQFPNSGAGDNGGADPTVPDLNWHYEVVTYDGTNWNFYLDGQLRNATPDTVGAVASTTGAPWAIGDGSVGGAGNLFPGNLCQVALYTQALTPAQIYDHYFAGTYGATNLPPQIISQPASATVFSNAPAPFSVIAASTAPLSYQWWFGGSPIGGQTNPTFLALHAGTAEVGDYTVVLTNVYGAITSSVATLALVELPASVSYPTAVLSNGPVGYWPLDLSEDTGGHATDLSGNGNYGNYTNITAANKVAGPSSYLPNAVSFDGSTTWVDLSTGSNPTLLNFGGKITLEAWAKPSAANTWGFIIGKGWDGSGNEMELYANGNDGTWGGGAQNSNGRFIPDFGTETAGWTYLVITFDGTRWNYYVNGQLLLQESDTVGAPNFANIWGIGAAYGNGTLTTPFQGNICQVSLYTNALTPQQVYLHYIAGEYGGAANLLNLISSQPANAMAYTNGLATFSVTASGMPSYYYQWYVVSGGTTNAIAGAINAAYSTPPVQANMDGNGYFVVVDDSAGREETSVTARLTVVALEITAQPASLERYPGKMATFSVNAKDGSGNLFNYQWWKVTATSTNRLVGQTNASLTLANVQSTDGAGYYVVVANSVGSVTSDQATLTVETPSAYDSTVLNDGALAFYPLDETNGTTAYDPIGGYDGTYQNSPTLNVAGPSTYLRGGTGFNGTSQYVRLPSSLPDITNQITLEAWVQLPASPLWGGLGNNNYPYANIILHDHQSTFLRIDNEYDVSAITNVSYQIGTYDSTKNAYVPSFSAIPGGDYGGSWVHLVGEFDGTNWDLYHNGVLVATNDMDANNGNVVDTVGALPGTVWMLAAGTGGTANFFQGNIAGVALYNYALTSDQVAAHYEIGLTGTTNANLTLSIASSPGGVTLNWPAGSLQEATNVLGPYDDVSNAASPYTEPTTNRMKFYRLRQ